MAGSEPDSDEQEGMQIYRDVLKADMFKERGNHHFKVGDYDEAVNSYTIALEADLGNPTLYANRAMALLKIAEKQRAKLSPNLDDPLPHTVVKFYTAADQDCSQALRLDKDFVKAYYRRGQARKALGMLQEAVFDFETVLRLEPKNTVADHELESLRRQLSARGKQAKRFFSEFRSIPVEAIQKNDWKGELKRIRIEERNAPEIPRAEVASEPAKMECDSVVKVPPPARTAFQFYADWRHLEKCPDARLEYLFAVGAAGVEKLFKESLEVNILTDIISLLHRAFRTGNCTAKVLSLMAALPNVGRFQTLAMFLEAEEIRKVRDIVSADANLLQRWHQS